MTSDSLIEVATTIRIVWFIISDRQIETDKHIIREDGIVSIGLSAVVNLIT